MEKLGKPVIKLKPLERTAIELPTEKIALEVMRICESGNWKCNSGNLPTEKEFWNKHKEKTCIDAGYSFSGNLLCRFGYSSKEFYDDFKWKIIKHTDFYDLQPDVTPEKIIEINTYFDNLPKKDLKPDLTSERIAQLNADYDSLSKKK